MPQVEGRQRDGNRPVRVTGDEDFPVELTLAKTYDRLFDGIDFGAADEADLIALDGNPLTEIEAVKRVRFVMRGGRVVP